MKDAKGHGSEAHGAHSAGVDQVGKYTTSNDVRDAHDGEIYGSVRAGHPASNMYVGKIDYGAVTQPHWKPAEVNVHMIEVAPEHQHQGVATQMMDKLREEFTSTYGGEPKIKWGMMTPEGSAFKKAYQSRKS